ncbi:hypothetical protein BO94DRAFT_267583 [Aspergillus sclerotioniger CBS 115572]|uniref:Uncharacterized protein n=1 Tax=Aspergillus sclerotioniger CBS 115572 TaxID=1450535 RepID=A0A317V9L2_9EURO|nr:hypothetical protein BO94DRAFT_267583 [Aspergillus sclerotioniger CBS 115572]PWY70876.1 hypothetical protein BO94DRAFT_267583 [Aspergillus sclerotioniger CBS 115572]
MGTSGDGVFRMQKRAAILVTGSFKSMAAAVFHIELHFLPMNWLIQQTIEDLIRVQTGPTMAQLEGARARRNAAPIKLESMTPLEALKRCRSAISDPILWQRISKRNQQSASERARWSGNPWGSRLQVPR